MLYIVYHSLRLFLLSDILCSHLADTKFVGPLTIQPPKKLFQELESFVAGAESKGVVIFSLGTLGDAVLQKSHVDSLAGAFGRLDQRVVWRLSSKQN